MWVMETITESQIEVLVTRNRLKDWEAEMILVTPQNPRANDSLLSIANKAEN